MGPVLRSSVNRIYNPIRSKAPFNLGTVTLKEDSIRTLERIRDNCTNLATLETSLRFRTINIIESAIDAPDVQLDMCFQSRLSGHGLCSKRSGGRRGLRYVVINTRDSITYGDTRTFREPNYSQNLSSRELKRSRELTGFQDLCSWNPP